MDCKQCGKKLCLKDEHAGRKARCKCGGITDIPRVAVHKEKGSAPVDANVVITPLAPEPIEFGGFSINLNLACPVCNVNAIAAGPSKQICPQCLEEFHIKPVTIRAKKSRGNKASHSREFDVRVKGANGAEELISFWSSNYQDIELRSADCVIFIKDRLGVRWIYNLTIARNYMIPRPHKPNHLLQAILLALAILAIILCCLANRPR